MLFDVKVRENIIDTGGNVQFHQWGHFKRIDYEIFNPSIENFIQTPDLRKKFLNNYMISVFIPNIFKYVPDAKVSKPGFETIDGIELFYISMHLPKASSTERNGNRLDACRCMLAHTNGKAMYIYTVSAPIGYPDGEVNMAAYEKTEKTCKRRVLQFYRDVKIEEQQ